MKNNTKGVFYAIIAVLIFGSSGVTCKYLALLDINMCFVSGVRFVLGSLTVAMFLLFRNSLRFYFGKRAKLVIVVAVFGIFLNYVSYQLSLNYISATVAILLESFSPAIVFLLSLVVLRRKITPKELISLILSLMGILIIVLGKGTLSLSSHSGLGVFLGFIAALSWAIYIFFSAEILRPIHDNPIKVLQFLFTIFVISSICCLPFFLNPSYYHQSFNTWMVLAELGIIQTGVVYIIWNYALSLISANTASIIFTLTIFLTALNEIIFLGFKLTLSIIIGGLLIILATNLACRKSKNNNKKANANIVKS